MKNIFWGWGSGSSPETDGAKRLTFDSVLHRFSRVRLCHPMDCSPPCFSVHGVLQARICTKQQPVLFADGPLLLMTV